MSSAGTVAGQSASQVSSAGMVVGHSTGQKSPADLFILNLTFHVHK